MEDVNEFCRELRHYNDKICIIRKALKEAEQALVVYLGLHDIETLYHSKYKMNLEHVTMAIFYSFASYFQGDYLQMLDVKFSDEEPPYFTINVYHLDDVLRDAWAKYTEFVEMLERARHFTQALLKKYRTYYNDYYKRMHDHIIGIELKKRRSDKTVQSLVYNFDTI